MSLTTDDFEEFVIDDERGGPLGDALSELAVEVEVDSVDTVRDLRERLLQKPL